MKKVFLSLVFVFGMGTMVNANSSLENQKSTVNMEVFDCFALAHNRAERIQRSYGLSDEETVQIFAVLYGDCFDAIME